MFGNLFNRKPQTQILHDLSKIAVDIHSHLLPGIDDGSQSLEESVSLILALKELGYKKLITTPHIMSDYYRNTPDVIRKGLDALREELIRQNIQIDIGAAAEYYFDEYFLTQLSNKNVLCIADEYLLFELSYLNKPTGVREAIAEIQYKGYKPLLAHPERYPYLSMDEYLDYKNLGCYFQLNILSLIGYYGKQSQKLAQEFIDSDMIDMLGTDLHRMKHAEGLGNTLYEPYLEKIIGYDFLLNKTLENKE